MKEHSSIASPAGEDDKEGAQRALEEFFDLYQPTFVILEQHLEHLIEETNFTYANAYKPWHKAVHDLLGGVYLLIRDIPLPDMEGFMDAVRILSFESAIQFLYDLCISCKLALQADWMEAFRKNIDILLFSLAILDRKKQQPSLAI